MKKLFMLTIIALVATVQLTPSFAQTKPQSYEAAWVSQTQPANSEEYFPVMPGKELEVEIRFKNTGTTTWKNQGADAITLAIYKDPKARSGPHGSCYSNPETTCSGEGKFGESYFVNEAWGNNYQVATLQETEVAPEQIGTFKIKFMTRKDALPGKYREDITLAYGKEWMNNTTNGDPIKKAHIWVGISIPWNQSLTTICGKNQTDQKLCQDALATFLPQVPYAELNTSSREKTGYWIKRWIERYEKYPNYFLQDTNPFTTFMDAKEKQQLELGVRKTTGAYTDWKNYTPPFSGKEVKNAILSHSPLHKAVKESKIINGKETLVTTGYQRSSFEKIEYYHPDKSRFTEAEITALQTVAEVPDDYVPDFKWGITVNTAKAHGFPVIYAGEAQGDEDDDSMMTRFNLGIPVAILYETTAKGPQVVGQTNKAEQKWYYVQGFGNVETIRGWVMAEDIAVTKTKQELIDFTAAREKNPTLVTGKNILFTIPNSNVPVEAKMGVYLQGSNGRVTLPTRGKDGFLQPLSIALPSGADTQTSPLDLNVPTIISQATKSLGQRWIWSWEDCSSFIQDTYRTMGVELSRGSWVQSESPGIRYYFDAKTDDQTRLMVLKQLPPGTLLAFPGHIMMLLGFEDDTPIVKPIIIQSVKNYFNLNGILVKLEENDDYIRTTEIQNITQIKRKNGKTFLQSMETATVFFPWKQAKISSSTVKVENDFTKK